MRLKRECFARGFSLCDMAETFVHLVRNKPASDYALGEVRDMYLNDCRDRGLRSSTLAYYTGKLANLCAMYGEKIPVSAITPDMLEERPTTTGAFQARSISFSPKSVLFRPTSSRR